MRTELMALQFDEWNGCSDEYKCDFTFIMETNDTIVKFNVDEMSNQPFG